MLYNTFEFQNMSPMWFTDYYKKFIVGYAKIIKPLFSFTKKNNKVLWGFIC